MRRLVVKTATIVGLGIASRGSEIHVLKLKSPFPEKAGSVPQDSDSVAAETRMAGARPAMLPMALV
jgi:hypothetical protein